MFHGWSIVQLAQTRVGIEVRMALELLAYEHAGHVLGPLGQRHAAKITAGIFFLRQAKGGWRAFT